MFPGWYVLGDKDEVRDEKENNDNNTVGIVFARVFIIITQVFNLSVQVAEDKNASYSHISSWALRKIFIE